MYLSLESYPDLINWIASSILPSKREITTFDIFMEIDTKWTVLQFKFLVKAILNGDVKAVNSLISQGANVNQKDK